MINKADVIERLGTLVGKEVTSENLHEALFCEDKHQKIRRRFHVGSHTYVQYKVKIDENSDSQAFVDLRIPGNPNTFRVNLEERDGQLVFHSNPNPRISYSYL
ncbi:hypothetical protein ACFYKX_08810 [Cytobacillus sp. FJAT-54145]|uniref:Uncharacterized protein n=1 Tax=Cytobacillus spartinae TaxID=3299023 RepID=A0ABW6KDE6_9BACI